ncbi:NAD(P)/FAD-dependent oxidoreductase [Mycoplasma sp. HS2188]|uniref:NAD(P)/FAD-dependent oxidoreductase n=1 Tax=Mycoplasma sp. HS2188 TaxID=2976765 RepID=UPI0021A99998|nr:NAD(P)/FAD-dependent oxidoreductase [Mycoplasma sp. HS2188]MCT4469647.1 NAD(P)/FAD-dependent oxidoreductase [Mycoplasma sp. HS2188]
MDYDVIIIGTGPAGSNAALYAARGGLKTLIIEKENTGGKIVTSATVENWLGIPTISGYDLGEKMVEHAKENGAKLIIGEVVKINSLSDFEKEVVLKNGNVITAKSIIIATGLKHREPTFIKNYDKFRNNGVHFCTTCDAPLYRNKNVVILGGGNSAVEEAIFAARFVNHVDMIVLNEITADKVLVDALQQTENITVYTKSQILELNGDENGINEIVVQNNETNEIKKFDSLALFSLIGFVPDDSIHKHLNLTDEKGFIKVNEDMETAVKNIYAAGDIIVKKVRQLITAAADGCIAAKTLIDKLNLNK